jgi:hypothetical protein
VISLPSGRKEINALGMRGSKGEKKTEMKSFSKFLIL